jgi:transcriptional regulator with XRE-family HTH domain
MNRKQPESIIPSLTQQELAILIGVSRSLVSHWQAGRRSLPEYARRTLVELLDRYRVAGDQNPKAPQLEEPNESREAARLEEERKRQQRLQQAEVLKQELQAMRETYREGLKMLSTLEAMLIDDKSLTGLSRQMAYQQFKKRLERTGTKAQRALEEKIRRLEG